MKRPSAVLPMSGGGSRPDPRELAQLPAQTNALKGIHIIAGTKVTHAIGIFSEKARAAGATFQTFDTLTAMATAITERTHGKMAILADSSLITNPKDIKQVSDARERRKTTVPILLTRYKGKETLPLNVTSIGSTQDGIQRFVATVLEALQPQ